MQVLKRLLKAAVLLVAGFMASGLYAQTCSIPGEAGTATITAQPNTFFPGTGNPAAGATSIAVGAGTGLSSPISAGDLLLIIQMQGADINSTNTNAYGSGSSTGTGSATVAYGTGGYAGGVSGNLVAGNYEWALATSSVTYASGGTINLSAPLANAYYTRTGSTTQTQQAFQVIRVPQYANLTLGGGLTVQAWNGSTGGVLVLEATGDINLGGQTINGTGAGFRGAGAVNVNANNTCTANYNTSGCPAYVSLISASFGGSKGEGIAGTPARLYSGDPTGAGSGTVAAGTVDAYPNGEASRGAPGNAGGGGNQHNAGGGGGGNGGAGGNGGNTWNKSINGYYGLTLGGFGGAPSGNSASRWIMGGGGGAGDIGGNGTTSPDGSGGAGGGLVILRASRVVGGGATINVNGAPGQRSRATDAGGGGGAGGTVVVAAGSGGLSGALTVNAQGGAGGAYQAGTAEQDGPGGGGGGGVLITNVSGITFSATGGAGGASNTTSGCGGASNSCGAAAGAATAGSAGYAITSPGVQVGYECLPNLTVTKATSTPVVTSSTGATASYTIVVSNSGGAARFVNVLDTALPPGWTLAAAPTYSYSPAQPLAAGRLSSGAETVALTTASTWSVGVTPLSVPATGSNTLTWNSFAVAPVTGGVPAVVTITFVASIPDTATVGTYQNGAGVTFLDPTRAAATTRTVSPLANVSANRTAAAYSANTAYNNYAGGATTNVGGSNYNGLQTGPTTEDVQLVPDFSVTKTAPATAVPGTTFTYTITARNNGRPIGSQTYTVSQASDVSTANVPSVLGSNPLTVTDTLPAGITVSAASFTGTGWTCSGTSPMVCTLANASAYPVTNATSYPSISGTASFVGTCASVPSPATNTVAISTGVGETVTSNNTATAVTTASCATANITVTKSNGSTSVTAGSVTSYTLTVANLGPGNAPGTVLTDPAATGLSCSTVTCAVTAGTATCPSPLTASALQGAGLTIPSFNSGSTLTFVVSCGVTATGQ
jgi:uncharacterized repeat protein (TIGR01451 family)